VNEGSVCLVEAHAHGPFRSIGLASSCSHERQHLVLDTPFDRVPHQSWYFRRKTDEIIVQYVRREVRLRSTITLFLKSLPSETYPNASAIAYGNRSSTMWTKLHAGRDWAQSRLDSACQ
jgi:hypothetical protein